MNGPDTPSHKTLTWPAYSEPLSRHRFEPDGERAHALTRRGSLAIWFDPDMVWAADRTGKRGRLPVYSAMPNSTFIVRQV